MLTKITAVVPVKLLDEVKKAISKPASEWIYSLIFAEINQLSKI